MGRGVWKWAIRRCYSSGSEISVVMVTAIIPGDMVTQMSSENTNVQIAELHAIRRTLTQAGQPSSEIENAMRKLIAMLGDPSPLIRRMAVGGLDCHRCPWASENIARALVDDPDETVRLLAATQLGSCSSLTAAPEALLQALHDSSPKVRGVAANAIGRIGDRDAATELIGMLSDESPFARLEACMALLDMGISSWEVIQSLESLYGDPIVAKMEMVKQRGEEQASSNPELMSSASRTAFRSLDDLLQIARELTEETEKR